MIRWIFEPFVFAIIAAIIVSGAWTFIFILKEKWENRPLKKLLNFGDGKLLFVYTCWSCRVNKPTEHTEHPETEAILPHMAIEDVIAIHSVINVLREINWSVKWDIKCVHKLTDEDKTLNIVTVGSSKANIFTKDVFKELIVKFPNIFRFENIKDPSKAGRWRIKDGKTEIHETPSYEQIEAYKQAGKDVTEQEIDDVAIIAKVTNPFDEEKKNKVLILAGVRGIGTWGAASCVRREWKQIYDRKGKGGSKGYRKDGNFAAVIDVKYHNFSISQMKVGNLQDFS